MNTMFYLKPTYKAKAIICFCLIITANCITAQNTSHYIYKFAPEDTCLSHNNDILEANNRYYLFSYIAYNATTKWIPTVSVYDENLHKIDQSPLIINGIDPEHGFHRSFYKENHFYIVGFIPSDTQHQKTIFFAQYDANFHLQQQQISFFPDTITWSFLDVLMTKNNEFLLLFTGDYSPNIRLIHLDTAGKVLQEVFLPEFILAGRLVETDSYYIVNTLSSSFLLRFPKDSLENYEWIQIERHQSETSGSAAVVVDNQLIRDNHFYNVEDKCSDLSLDRSVVFLDEDFNVKDRLIFGTPCANDWETQNNMHYLNPDSIYYAYVSSTNESFWGNGGTSLCIANFSSEGELHFNHILDIQEDSMAFYILNCKAVSNGGVLVTGTAYRYDDNYPFNSRGFLLLYHPTMEFSNIQKHAVNQCMVFPNPAQSQVTITHTEDAVIHLYTILGQKVKQVTATQDNTTISLSDLSAGMYVLKIEKGNTVVTKKVQIVK